MTFASVWGLFLSVSLSLAASTPSKEALYLQATKLYNQQQYDKAAPLLRRVLPMFAKAQKAFPGGSRGAHQLTLAQCDILARLGTIAWKRQHKRRSCRLHQRVATLQRTLPPQWRKWTAHTPLPKRLNASQGQLQGACQQVPSLLVVKGAPPGAVLSLQATPGKWLPQQGLTLAVTTPTATIKVKAKGFLPKVVRDHKVPRWQTSTLVVELKPRPRAKLPAPRVIVRPRVAVIRPPPRPRPPVAPAFYKTWWFWTITGVVVAGGASAAIIVATQPKDFVFKGESANTPFSLWQ